MSKKILFAFVCLFAINAHAVIRYVKPDGTTLAENAVNATSWLTACADLQAVINASGYDGDTIFVAAGTYKPIRQASVYRSNTITLNGRENSFVIRKDIYLFGNFAGTESSPNERQLPASGDYTSILSGDFNNDDGVNFSGMTENAYHVLLIIDQNMARNVRIDGFTIRGGNANGGTTMQDVTTVESFQFEKSRGGGIFCIYGVAPVLTNMKITGNTVTSAGGGIYNYSSNPILNNVIISGNKVTGLPKSSIGAGGGICNAFSSPVLTNVVISGNISFSGGGIYNSYGIPVLNNVSITGNSATGDSGGGMINYGSNPVLTNVIISGNTSVGAGGGMYIGGSNTTLISGQTIKDVVMTNVVISGNTSGTEGGGIYVASASPILTNVTISKNTAKSGSGMYNYSYSETSISTPKVRNSIIWGNITDNVYNTAYSVPAYSNSLVGGETITAGVILNTDPLLNTDFRLQKGSPCIDAGDNSLFNATQIPNLSAITKDLDDKLRIVNTVDLGACEYQFHSVTFAGEDINIASQTIEHHNYAIAPKTPERTGYDFAGWFTDNGTFSNTWNFETNLVAQDTILWAKWNKQTGINEVESVSVNIYPNPVKDGITVKITEPTDLTIYTISGQVVLSRYLPLSSYIPLNNLVNGSYIVKIRNGKGLIQYKLIKE